MRTLLPRLRTISHVLLGFALLLIGAIPESATFAKDVPPADPRLEVIVVIDSGARNFGQPMQTARRAASTYIRSLPKTVDVGVISFSQGAAEVRQLSKRHDAAVAAISELKTDGDSNLFDALDFAADKFAGNLSVKKQLVVATDGADTASFTKLETVVTKLATIGVRVDVLSSDSIEGNPVALDLLTSRTSGGRIPAASLKDVRLLAGRTVEWARPPVPVLPKQPSIFSRILSSKIALGLGLVLVFGGLTLIMLMLTAPKPKKVALTDFTPAATVSSSSAAVTGIATAITGVADRVLEKQGKAKGLNVLIEKAGMILKAGEFMVISIAFGVVCSAVAYLSFGLIGSLVALPLCAFVLPRKFLKRKAKKRSLAFGEQLSDMLQLLSSSLRAGQGLMQAVDSVAREGDPPASEEFRRVVVEARLGRDLIDSLRSMSDRLDSEDFGWVIPAIEINREVGGDLAEVLDTVGQTVRDRADIRRQVKTLSAEGRLSAYVLLALPIVIAMMVRASNPTYIAELTKGAGIFVSAAGILMMTIGGFWLFSLCKIEF